MKKVLSKINKGILMACVSMYFGTGWSLVFFQFPSAENMTPANYYQQMVPQITRATDFFTIMTIIMFVSAVLLVIQEWRSRNRWFPIGVLAGIIAATLLTTIFIFPYNEQLGQEIQQAAEFREVLQGWISVNYIRVSIWTFEWLCMTLYFLIDLDET